MNSTNRKNTYTGDTSLCDDGLTEGWYRFEGGAGTRMPTKLVGMNRCGTAYPGWLNGNHPTVADGVVTRKVCFHQCDGNSNIIKVKKCTSYFIYRLLPTGGCPRRYCGTD